MMKALFDQFVTRVSAEYNVETEKGNEKGVPIGDIFYKRRFGARIRYLLFIVYYI